MPPGEDFSFHFMLPVTVSSRDAFFTRCRRHSTLRRRHARVHGVSKPSFYLKSSRVIENRLSIGHSHDYVDRLSSVFSLVFKVFRTCSLE